MIYEVRTYTLQPGSVAEFEERYQKRLALRERHSKLGPSGTPSSAR
jgi:heme-degrading monooxygenase HmoA